MDMDAKLNVLGEPLLSCSEEPVTGFFRDGCCNTSPEDLGLHAALRVVQLRDLKKYAIDLV
jgi:hypothetical protein